MTPLDFPATLSQGPAAGAWLRELDDQRPNARIASRREAMSDPAPAKAEADDRSWMIWTLIGLGAIWLAVLAISLWAPDLISGSQQEHLPLALFVTWIWGLVGSIGYLWGMSKLRGAATRRALWIGLVAFVTVTWGIAAVLSITLPVWETGTDPTRLPLAAIAAPLAAALVTTLASVVAGIFSQPPS
jgi:hypothetical protein